MKLKPLMALITLTVILGGWALPGVAKDTWVSGYTRQNGTQVQGYYRTAPDSNPYNNYSTQGNYNPYTGARGTVNPYGGSGPSGTGLYTPGGGTGLYTPGGY